MHEGDRRWAGSEARMDARRGFTLIELMIVVSIMGTALLFAYPSLRRAAEAGGARSARQSTLAYLTFARATAKQHGATTRFIRSGNSIRVIVDSAGTAVVVARSRDLGWVDGVSVTATRDTITFGPRGYAEGLTGPVVLRFTRGAASDSLCVMRAG
jgi:prepilin-type N-terminal cleavage/methylation domain-containing protein